MPAWLQSNCKIGPLAGLALAALLTACGSSGSGGSGNQPAQPSQPVQPGPTRKHPDVVPFDSARAGSWPGLPNVGMSCFMNTSIKLLAAMPELDPFLTVHPGDDQLQLAVRSSLRATINFIRSGGAPVPGETGDARTRVEAVLAAFRAHPQLQAYVAGVGGLGGDPGGLVRSVFKVLGVKGQFDLQGSERTVHAASPAPPRYQAATRTELFITTATAVGGHDLARIQTLGEFTRMAFSEPGSFAGSGAPAQRRFLATAVPANLLLDVIHHAPTKALQFSEDTRIPVFRVDPARHAHSKQGEVVLQAAALSVFRGGHLWAAIRGHDGWYANDDGQPARRILQPNAELDEQGSGQGDLHRSITMILYRPVP